MTEDSLADVMILKDIENISRLLNQANETIKKEIIRVVNKWNNFDSTDIEHKALMFGSILLTLMSGGATAPLLLAFGFDVADAYLWHEQGNDFMAGMSLFFGLLPGLMLAGPPLKSAMKELGLAYKEAKVMGI